MKKRYIDGKGKFWNESYVVIDNMRIYNPSEEQLAEAGYTEYTAPPVPEPTEQELLEKAKQMKLIEIENYDLSDNVNSFTLGNMQMWLDFEERQRLMAQIQARMNLGMIEMTKQYGSLPAITFPLTTWKQMADALEVYAGDCQEVTNGHKAAVNALSTIEEVDNYDYTVSYPTKLHFSV